jgi:hypothetical protein
MIILLFGILGVQLFGGNLSQKCYSAATGAQVPGQDEWAMCSIATGSGTGTPPAFVIRIVVRTRHTLARYCRAIAHTRKRVHTHTRE